MARLYNGYADLMAKEDLSRQAGLLACEPFSLLFKHLFFSVVPVATAVRAKHTVWNICWLEKF